MTDSLLFCLEWIVGLLEVINSFITKNKLDGPQSNYTHYV